MQHVDDLHVTSKEMEEQIKHLAKEMDKELISRLSDWLYHNVMGEVFRENNGSLSSTSAINTHELLMDLLKRIEYYRDHVL